MSLGPTLRGIFNRVDTNRDGALDRAEVQKFVEDAGVGSGWFGGTKVSGTVQEFQDRFDANRSGVVGWSEFKAQGRSLIPGTTASSTPAELRALGQSLVDMADADADDFVTRDELAAVLETEMSAKGVSMAGTKAEIAAKLALHSLDTNHDGAISRDEVDSLAADVARELSPPPPAPTPDPAPAPVVDPPADAGTVTTTPADPVSSDPAVVDPAVVDPAVVDPVVVDPVGGDPPADPF